MKIISWNVNGIRACIQKGFIEYIKKENPDVLCIQETKAHPEQLKAILPEYQQIWNSAEKKGYAGTATFTKEKPIAIAYGLEQKKTDEEDTEGRIIITELKEQYIVNAYVPNARHELTRLDFRMEWDKKLHELLRKLTKQKQVILCGDLNVAHKEIDLANPQSNRRNPGFTDEERESFTKLLQQGFIDTFREFNTEPNQYTWWSYKFSARKRNIGWRIDYVCISKELRKHLREAFIRKEIEGSDHCPVGITLQ